MVVGMISLLASVAFYVLTQNLLILSAPFVLLYLLLCISNWKFAYWILLGSIIISVQMSLVKTLSLSLPDEPVCWILSVVLGLVIAYRSRVIPHWWTKNPVIIIIFIQFLWLLVAVLYSTVFFFSVKFLFAKIWYLICFLIFPIFIIKNKKDFKNLFFCILIPLVATIVIILIRQIFLKFCFNSISTAIGNIYVNHVEYGAVLSICYPIIWVAWSLSRTSIKRKQFYFILILLFAPILYFSFARAAILAVLFAAFTGYAIKKKFATYIMPCVYGIMTVSLFYFISGDKYINLRPDYDHTVMHNDYASHLMSTFQGRDVSSMERLYRWVAAIRMSADRPLVGYGPHGFVENYKRYTLSIFKTFSSENNERSTTHNYFLFMLTEQGWPAMLLYALLIAVVLARAQKTYHRLTDRFYKGCTLALAMAFAATFVNNFFSEFIETHKVGALFYLIIALLLILEQKSKDQELTLDEVTDTTVLV